jgi:hypothetical protein
VLVTRPLERESVPLDQQLEKSGAQRPFLPEFPGRDATLASTDGVLSHKRESAARWVLPIEPCACF